MSTWKCEGYTWEVPLLPTLSSKDIMPAGKSELKQLNKYTIQWQLKRTELQQRRTKLYAGKIQGYKTMQNYGGSHWTFYLTEENSSFMWHQLHVHGHPQKFFQGGKRRNFVYPVQVADDAMQIDVHKTLYHFHPHYFVLVEPQFSIFCLKIFSTLRLSVMLFLFIKCLVSTFSSTFYKKVII